MKPPAATTLTRRQETAAASRAETRRRLLESAAREFESSSYAAATVSRIAAGAGVTVQTLYLAWGSKRELLQAYMDAALSGGRDAPDAEARSVMTADAVAPADRDARATIVGLIRFYRLTAERAATGWQLYRDGAATDPAIAEDWRGFQSLRRETFRTMIGQIPPRSLKPGLTLTRAADTAWAIASPETYDLLVRHGGYSLDQYEKWVVETVTVSLLPPQPGGPSHHVPSIEQGR